MTVAAMSGQLITEARQRLYAAVISDILDSLGLRNQALPSEIRALDDTLVLMGRARTGLYREVYHVVEGENPYELEMALVDDLGADDVAVLACAASPRIVPWGELLSTAAEARGAAGCLTDGLVRDSRMIRAMRFPVFSRGTSPLDTKGRGTVAAIDVPVEIGGVVIRSGDLVFGDGDGVIIIPAAVAAVVLERAFEKVSGEDVVRKELAGGDRLLDVFARHGIL